MMQPAMTAIIAAAIGITADMAFRAYAYGSARSAQQMKHAWRLAQIFRKFFAFLNKVNVSSVTVSR
jgi:plasmid maintenance system antidote protein VapI